MKALLAGLLLTTSVVAGAADTGAAPLLACVRNNVPSALRVQDIELTSTDRNGGVRSLKGHLYARRDAGLIRAVIRITAPENVAGAAYLVRETSKQDEDDMYVWLPAVRRARHITGSFANGSLLGTDFSYAEVKLIQNSFADAAAQLDGTDTVDGRPTKIVSLTPQTAGGPYDHIRAWVDDASCVVLKAEFDRGSKVRKRLSGPTTALTQIGRYGYLSQMTMDDLEAGTRTTLQIGSTSGADETLATRYFDPQTFYLGR